jgi:hypothetical protein
VEQLPKEVKIEGLENRLKKSKEGVSQWEVNPFLESLFQSEESLGRTIPRGQLLDHVYEASPAFTHTEMVLDPGGPNNHRRTFANQGGRLGEGQVVGKPEWHLHNEPGTQNYQEILLNQLGASQIHAARPTQSGNYPAWHGGHWSNYPDTIAHARVGERVRCGPVSGRMSPIGPEPPGGDWRRGVQNQTMSQLDSINPNAPGTQRT